jgi:manganese/zinc/iron transport system permease protein
MMDYWQSLWTALTLGGGYNSVVVMAGLAALGAAAGPIGALMILKRRPLLADAVAHATLPGVAIGFLIGLWLTGDGRNSALLLAGAALTGAAAAGAMHLLKDGARISEDAATAAALSVSFGLGVALLSLIQALPAGGQAGLNAFLLGQAATLNMDEAWVLAGTSGAALILLALLFKEFAYIAFDAEGARAQGLPVKFLDLMITGLMLLLIAAGLRAVGLVLILALLVTPAAAARFWTDRLPPLAALAALIGAAGAYAGGAVSAALPKAPTGAAIVLILSAIFLFSLLFAPKRGALAAIIRRQGLRRALRRRQILVELAAGAHPADPRLACKLGWIDAGGAPTTKGEAAAQAWLRDEQLRDRYLADRPEDAGRLLAAAFTPITDLLPRDVIAELERREA